MRIRLLICVATVVGLATPFWAQDAPIKAQDTKTYLVPFKLTDTQHVMVRAKINGKGPFNFIIDTGAPLLYVSIPVAKKLGSSPAPWMVFANSSLNRPPTVETLTPTFSNTWPFITPRTPPPPGSPSGSCRSQER